MALSRKLKIGAALLCVLVLAIWGVFYLHSAGAIRRSDEGKMQQVSTQIIDRLENELLGLENTAYTLAGHPAVLNFASEQNAIRFHEKSAAVDETIATLAGASTLTPHILVYSTRGVWANFMGELGAPAAITLQKALDAAPAPHYMAATLEGVRYISYARAIGEDAGTPGALVLLVEEDHLLGLFSEYTTDAGLHVSLAENGTIVTSSYSDFLGHTLEQAQAESGLLLSRKIGFAPFEVVVSIESGYLARVSRDYALAALLTIGLLFALLVAVVALANRHLFRPMLHVIKDVEALGGADGMRTELAPTGEAAFDGLVGQINRMLKRLDERSRALMQAQARLQTAELERQQALVISLKKQINAHFTVNVLNDVKALAEHGETEKAAVVSDGLSHLLRYANDEDEFIGGMDEYFVLEKYVAIMRIRYSGRFEAEFDWDDRLGSARMPRMLMQPILENAITHGLVPKRGGSLRVAAKLEGDRVAIRVADDGVGMNEKSLRRLMEHMEAATARGWTAAGVERIALANIRRRLWSYYGEAFTLAISSREGAGTEVSLSFPADYRPGRQEDNSHV